MRRTALFLTLALLAGCGSKDNTSSGPGFVQSMSTAIGGSGHTCGAPVPSGSAEQVACHEAAKAACPEGMDPNRVDFTQPTSGRYAGQFLVKGYSCV